MCFEVGVLGDFFVIKGWRSKDIEIFQATTLQQFGYGTLQRHAEVRVRAEGGEAGAICRVEQYHADNRIFAAQRAVISKDWETFCFQFGDGFHHARVARQHVSRDLRQADGFSNNAVFDMTLENFRQSLHARFVAGITGRHAVRHIQVADDVHRDINGLLVRLTGERQGADPTILIAGLQVDQHAAGQFVFRIVERAQAGIENAFRQFIVFGQREPFFVRIVNERTVGNSFAQPEVGEEVVGGQTLKILTQCRGQRRFLVAPLPLVKHSAQSLSRICTDQT